MAKQLKNKLNKKTPLLMSPFGFALAACGGGSETTGKISPSSSFGLTNDSFKDATTQGSYWTPVDNVLTYAVANGFNGEAWNDPSYVNGQLTIAMNNLSYFTNMKVQNMGTFSDVTAAANAGATIVLSLDGEVISTNLGNSVWAVGFFPDRPNDLYDNVAGDMFLNTNSAGAFLPDAAYEVGGAGFTLLLHELGHTLGLKHSHDDGGTGRPTYAQAGYADYDDQTYTVMSYDDEFGSVLNAPGTFMMVDALALMDLYGVNNSTNAGNTVHHISEADARHTIWDASGTDTVDLSSNANDMVVYLSTVKPNPNLDVSFGYVTVNAFTTDAKVNWLLGDYENVIGGSGDDIIDGNEFSNIIKGNAGNDTIDGWGGDDILYGGAGADVFVKGSGEGNDIIKDFEVGLDSCEFYNSALNRDDSIATLSSTAEGYALYTLTDNTTLLLDGTLFTDVAAIA